LNLFSLNKTGLLTRETTFVLSHLNSSYDWKDVESQLYSSGLTSSKKRAYEIVYELKKRFIIENPKLPTLDELVALAKSPLTSLCKAEVYFVYLYYTDSNFSEMMNLILQIYDHNQENPLIMREDIKRFLTNILRNSNRDINIKTQRNWIGKFLSILKEINLLITKSRNTYLINVGSITYETWTFFALHACLNDHKLLDAPFLRPFHITPSLILDIIKRGKDKNWIKYKILDKGKNQVFLKLETPYESVIQWLEDF